MDRRRFLWLLSVGALSTACASPAASPTAAPQPTTAPTTAAAAPPASPAAKPAATTAPSKPTPAPTAAAKAAPPKVAVKAILAYPTPSITASVFYLGVEKGYFRDEGVDLELQQVPSANAIKAMLAGELQFTSAAGTAAASIVSGAPMKLILLSTHGPVAWLYARSQFKTVADLKGGSIAIAAPGDFSHNLARAALAAAKLDPDTDVTYVAIPGASRNRLQAVIAGSADAAVMTPPENLVADEQGLSKLMFLSDQVKLSTDGAATTDALIKEKPEVVRSFVRGGIKALNFLKHDKAGAVPYLAQFMSIEPEQAAAIYDTSIPGFSDVGYEADDTLQATIEDQKRVSEVTRQIPITEVFDLSFAKQAAADLKASGWKP